MLSEETVERMLETKDKDWSLVKWSITINSISSTHSKHCSRSCAIEMPCPRPGRYKVLNAFEELGFAILEQI